MVRFSLIACCALALLTFSLAVDFLINNQDDLNKVIKDGKSLDITVERTNNDSVIAIYASEKNELKTNKNENLNINIEGINQKDASYGIIASEEGKLNLDEKITFNWGGKAINTEKEVQVCVFFLIHMSPLGTIQYSIFIILSQIIV